MRPRQKGARPPSQGRQRVSRGRTGWHLGQQTGQTGGPIQGRHLVGLSDASLNVPASSRANWPNVFARAPDIRTSPRTSADTGVRLSRAATGTVRRRQRDCPDCQEELSRGVLMLGFRTFTHPGAPDALCRSCSSWPLDLRVLTGCRGWRPAPESLRSQLVPTEGRIESHSPSTSRAHLAHIGPASPKAT